jgi:putative ABC transport system substrate-binding protein
MAAEMVRRQVAVIVATGGTAAALAAKAATTTIPLVFSITDDPVALGLVASLARPGGNATGVTFLLAELGAKQLGLLRELVPDATHIGLLVNPNNTTSKAQTSDVVAAASVIGVKIDVVRASDSREIEVCRSAFPATRTAPFARREAGKMSRWSPMVRVADLPAARRDARERACGVSRRA